jgi:RNA-directed DNA polymerase
MGMELESGTQPHDNHGKSDGSPLLANVYLHYVFDLWVEAWRKKAAKGDVIVVRYAE